MRLINFAHGELIMVGGYAVVLLGIAPWPLVILATLAIVVVFALAMERIAFRPVRGASPATLLDHVVRGQLPAPEPRAARLRLAAEVDELRDVAEPSRSRSAASTIAKLDVLTVVVALVLLALLGAVPRAHDASASQMRAAAEDFRMARVLGVQGEPS